MSHALRNASRAVVAKGVRDPAISAVHVNRVSWQFFGKLQLGFGGFSGVSCFLQLHSFCYYFLAEHGHCISISLVWGRCSRGQFDREVGRSSDHRGTETLACMSWRSQDCSAHGCCIAFETVLDKNTSDILPSIVLRSKPYRYLI